MTPRRIDPLTDGSPVTATGRPGASRDNAPIRAGDDDAPARRKGAHAGYEGKQPLGRADMQFRAMLSRLARDPDPEARRAGAQLAQEAADALTGLATRAEQASTAYKRLKARDAKLGAQLAARQARHGG